MSPESAFEAFEASEAFEGAVAEVSGLPGVTRRTMFGRDTLLARGHPFAFRDGDRIALKLPDAVDVVAHGAGTTPVMGRRVMRQWVAVPHHHARHGPAGDAAVGRGAARRPVGGGRAGGCRASVRGSLRWTSGPGFETP